MKILIFILLPLFAFCQVKIDKTLTTNISSSKTNNISRDKTDIYVSKTHGDFDNVNDAINSITDASYSKQYNIYVDTGTWIFTQAAEYNLTASKYAMFRTKDYVNIIGNNSVFDASLPDTTVVTTGNYSTINFTGTNTVSGLIIKATNIKYAIHDDYGSANDTVVINNCALYHYGNSITPNYKNSYGCGTSSGRVIEFNNTTFNSGIYVHTNRNFTNKSKVTFNNCTFNSIGTEASIVLQPLNSLKEDSVYLNNCTIDSINYNYYMYQSDTSLIPYDLAEVKISGNSSYGFNNYSTFNTSEGSLMFVATDSVRLISGTTTIFRNSVSYTDTIISRLEVGEWNGCPNTKMGLRLKDCSSVNKEIVLSVNGATQTITFDEDFTSQTNAYILNFINLQLIDCTASLYSWASFYNPFE